MSAPRVIAIHICNIHLLLRELSRVDGALEPKQTSSHCSGSTTIRSEPAMLKKTRLDEKERLRPQSERFGGMLFTGSSDRSRAAEVAFRMRRIPSEESGVEPKNTQPNIRSKSSLGWEGG